MTEPANKSGVALRAVGVSKQFRRVSAGFHLRTLKSALLDRTLTRGLTAAETINALQAVSFEIGRGQSFGVIGGNGSGKSTLLKIVAGLLKPSSGELMVDGRVAALIELGAGFHPEISGRENIFINGAMMGLSRKEIEQRYQQIVDFSGLDSAHGNFLEEPVKNYSSGMYVRLGFSVAIHTRPDILLVDEVLSVGDEAFGRKCLRRIEEYLERGGTLMVVSHSLDLVETLCDRVLWLEQGVPRMIGEPRRVIDAYRQHVAEQEGREHQQEADQSALEAALETGGEEDLRWGSGQAEITAARCLIGAQSGPQGRDREERYQFESGAPVTFEIEVSPREALDDVVFGVAIATPRGVECWGTNTDLAGYESRSFRSAAIVRLHCPSLRLAPGEYAVDVAAHARDGSPYDYRRRVFHVTVTSHDRGIGVYFPEHRWESEGGVEWQSLPSRPSITSED
jgi:ABC-type polysaccharide/polyol phosphate transport system ATPase subunit